jgi:alginate O-acetyltransferase complex protein AlgI
MLFNSYSFISLFLPVVLLGYFASARLGDLAPVIWLALASLVVYSVSSLCHCCWRRSRSTT